MLTQQRQITDVTEIAAWEAREQTLLWPGQEVPAAELDRLLAPGFHEIGASGKRLGRQFGLDTLNKRRQSPQTDKWATSDLQVHELQPGVILLTYKLHRSERESMRSTLWVKRSTGGWQAVFHQGTPVP